MAAGSPLVSAIVVGHNNWPDLELAVASALRQTYQPVEVIVVDNASTDATSKEVPRRFGNQVRYVRQANRGDSGGYNAGIALARGELVQLLDGDDLLAPTKIEKQASFLRDRSDVDIAYGDVRQFQTEAGPARWRDWDTRDHQDMLAVLLAPDGDGAGLLVQSALFRRTALERIGPWDETLYVADQDYWLRAAWAGCRFRHVPGALTFYRRHRRQMSGDSRAMARGMEAVWSKAAAYIDREPYRTMATRYLARLRLGLALTEPGLSRAETIARIEAARAVNASAIPRPLYAAARLTVRVPGGRALAGSRLLYAARRLAARLLEVER